jgi:hypothetical protein
MQGRTTYSTFHTGFPVDSKPGRAALRPTVATIDGDSFRTDTYTSTNNVVHTPFPVSRRPVPTCALASPHLPWLAGATTNEDEYPWKDVPVVALAGTRPSLMQVPFSGDSEYVGEFGPKAAQPALPHLAGICGRTGLLLPLPRRSLGVQFWSAGEGNHLYCMIPYNVPVPCSASQVFTTVHDNEETVRS